MAGHLHPVPLTPGHVIWRHKLTEPRRREVAHVRGAILLLREKPYVRLREMHGELLAVLGQDRDALPQQLDLLLVLNLKAHYHLFVFLSLLVLIF